MRIIPRIFVATLAVALMLSGCVPTTPSASRTPKASGAPVFASEAEALAAATKAYAAYVKVSDEILADGGAGPERINAVATGDALAAALSGYQEFRSKEWRSVGLSRFDHVTLQRLSNSSVDGTNLAVIYVCLDVSNVDVVDRNGTSVVSPQRPARQSFQVSEDWDKVKSRLVVSSREPWTDGGVCEKP
ncbi:hypothetical protein [Frigoribacterium sp. UYMn621]|uniref:hypothetical protein n=1 Tax=Frigoribacterium sp. UYMn621 TaxID=3156343 RepID=UPI0033955992